MKQVPVAKFKDRVSEYIAEAEAGGEIIITRHGRPAARIVPIVDGKALAAQRASAALRLAAFRQRHQAAGVRISAEEWTGWKNEGRP